MIGTMKLRLIPVFALLLMFAACGLANAQSVQTDKTDYAPGETATITGTGFHPNETVTVAVEHTDDTPDGGSGHVPWTVTTDGDGNFTTTWYVDPDDSGDSVFLLTADCQHPVDANDTTPHLHADWAFTDSVSSATISSVTAPGFGTAPFTVTYYPSGANIVVTVNFNYSTGTTGTTTGFATLKSGGTTFTGPTTSLATGANKSGSVQVTLPAGTGSGSYDVSVEVDNSASGGPSSKKDTLSSGIVISLDMAAPSSSISTNPSAPNAAGWFKQNVAISLSATDSPATNSGVKEIRYFTTGAQVIGSSASPIVAGGSSASFNITSEGTSTITYWAVDNAGNVEGQHTQVIKLDKTNPTLNFGAFSPAANANGWNNTNVSISYTTSDAISGIASSLPVSPLSFTTEGTNAGQVVTVTDNAGNSATFTSASVKIDKTIPTGSHSLNPAPNADGWNSGNVTLTINGSDSGSGVDYITYSASGAQNIGSTQVIGASTSFQLNKNGITTVTYTITDKAGNISATGTVDVKIDKAAPTVTLSTPADNTFVRAGINLTASASDNESGVDKVEFYVDGVLRGTATSGTNGSYQTALDTTGLSNGNHSWNAKAYDKVANTATSTTFTLKVDNAKPTTTSSNSPAATNGWNNSDVTVALNSVDNTNGSGVASISYSATGAQTIASATVPGATATVPAITAEGITVLTFNATDNAGNIEASQTLNVKIDKTKPVTTATPSAIPNAAGWNNTDVTVNLNGSDPGGANASGVASITYSVNGGSPIVSSGATASVAVTVEGNTTISYFASDNAGNVEAAKTITLHIDKTAPTLSFAYAPGANAAGWINANVTISYTASDALSGVASSLPASPVILTTEGAGQHVTITVTDVAGNSATFTSASINIDKTPPVLTQGIAQGTLGSNGWYKTDVTVPFTAVDSLSGLANSGDASFSLTTSSEGPAASTDSRDVFDQAGNKAVAGPITFKVDKTVPVISGNDVMDSVWRNTDLAAMFTASDGANGSGLANPADASFTLTASDESTLVGGVVHPTLVTRTVMDIAGWSSTRTLSALIDKTPPAYVVSDTVIGTKGNLVNGIQWYLTDVTASITASDVLSGLLNPLTDAGFTLSTSSEGASVMTSSREIQDKAGNKASVVAGPYAVDKTAPEISGTDVAETWRNTPLSISFTAKDLISGLANAADASFGLTVSAESVDAGHPTTASRSVADIAGNISTRSISALIDLTAPVVSLSSIAGTKGNADGMVQWYLSDVTVNYNASDALSGLANLADAAFQLNAAGEGNAVATGTKSVSDVAGNLTNVAGMTFAIDKTAPTIDYSTDIQKNQNGWFTAPVTFNFSAQDSVSGVASVSSAITYSGPDGANVSVTADAYDKAGNHSTRTIVFNYDAHAPEITVTGISNGAFVQSATVDGYAIDPGRPDAHLISRVLLTRNPNKGQFNEYDPNNPAGFSTISLPVSFGQGGDVQLEGNFTLVVIVSDEAGNTNTAIRKFTIDRTAPVIVFDPASPVDGGFYNSDRTLSWTVTDALSDIVTLLQKLMSELPGGNVGPDDIISGKLVHDDGRHTVTIDATDQANNSAHMGRSFTIDRTPPTTTPSASGTAAAPGWFKSNVHVSLSASDPNIREQSGDLAAVPGSGVDTMQFAGAGAQTIPQQTLQAASAAFDITTEGITVISFQSFDRAGNAEAVQTFTVKYDKTKPHLSVPANITVEATGSTGAAVTFSVSATDNVTPNPVIIKDHNSGETFPLGTTTVTVTATDEAGNSTTKCFSITVVDTTPPAITVPADMTIEATGPNGAAAAFSPSAIDIVDGGVNVDSSISSGSTFPLGETTVVLTAKDAHGNTSSASFTVTVVDTTPPVIDPKSVPLDMTVEATSAQGAIVSFASPTATDIVDVTVTVNCSPASQSQFPLGTTKVTCTATDKAGNSISVSFNVTVVDTTPPDIQSVPKDMEIEATSPAGAVANYTMPVAVDLVDGTDIVTTDHQPGTVFPVGATTVNFRAKDAAGNKAHASFNVVGSSRVDLQACKLEYSIVSPK